jgi:hypothetical protein
MSDEQQQLMSELLERQRGGQLTTDDRVQSDGLLAIDRRRMVRKAQALKLTGDRGLRPPLSGA